MIEKERFDAIANKYGYVASRAVWAKAENKPADMNVLGPMLNPDVVPKDIKSSDALVKAITANKDNPKLFREEMVFRKVKN